MTTTSRNVYSEQKPSRAGLAMIQTQIHNFRHMRLTLSPSIQITIVTQHETFFESAGNQQFQLERKINQMDLKNFFELRDGEFLLGSILWVDCGNESIVENPIECFEEEYYSIPFIELFVREAQESEHLNNGNLLLLNR
jgi:hypothetical protein